MYPEFSESETVIEPFDVPFEWQDKLSIDPGLNNPLSCHWYCVDGDGNVYAVAEHYAAGHDVGWHSERIRRNLRAARLAHRLRAAGTTRSSTRRPRSGRLPPPGR